MVLKACQNYLVRRNTETLKNGQLCEREICSGINGKVGL